MVDPMLNRLLLASVELAALAIGMAIVTRAVRVRSPRVLALLWLIVLVKPLVSLAAGSPYGVVILEVEPAASAAAADASGAGAAAPTAELHVEPAREPPTRRDGAAVRRALEPSPERDRARGPASFAGTAEARATSAAPADPWPWVLLSWWLGVAVMISRNAAARVRLRRMVRRAREPDDALRARYRALARRLGLRRVPRLRVTDDLESPAITGLLRPTILVPRWLAERARARKLRWSLAHELSHSRWLDPWSIMVRDLAAALFFFHPGAWWAGRKLDEAIELACDRASLGDAREATPYAALLYEVLLRARARRRAGALPGGALAMVARGRAGRRVAALLESDDPMRRPVSAAEGALLSLFAALVLTFGAAFGCAAADQGRTPSGHRASAGPPDLFVMGSFYDLVRDRLGDRVRSTTGRTHRIENYDDIFEDPRGVHEIMPGDLMVLTVSLDEPGRVPEPYADLLPQPWSQIAGRLESGRPVALRGDARSLEVVLLAAPTKSALEQLVRDTDLLGQDVLKPYETVVREHTAGSAFPPIGRQFDLFVFGPGGAAADALGAAGSRCARRTARAHAPASYREIFDADREPGDVLVLLLSREAGNEVPEGYRDLLPRPWAEIETRLDEREVVELTGDARGMHVLLVAARTEARLQRAVRDSAQIAGIGDPDLFCFGPCTSEMFFQLIAMAEGVTGSRTGRTHDDASYREIFADPKDARDLSVGDVLVLLATLAEDGRPPAEYLDLLPRPWSEIEARLERGRALEITGSARGLNVILLAAPADAALPHLIDDASVFPVKVSREEAVRRFMSAAAVAPTIEPFEERAPEVAEPTRVRYAVAISEDDRRTARVELHLGPAERERDLTMAPGAGHLDDGYATWVRNVTAADARGDAVAIEKTGPRQWTLGASELGVTVRYDVLLRHDERRWPEGGPDEAPYATDADVFWTGRALFLGGDLGPATVEWRLPEGWHASTQWPRQPGANAFYVADDAGLRESCMLLGSHQRTLARSGATEVLIAVGEALADTAPYLKDAVERMLAADAELFGDARPGRMLLVANAGGGGGLNGGVIGRSISLLSGAGLAWEQRREWLPFVAHEVLHLWNGRSLTFRDHDYWFSEGFTEYYAYVTCARQHWIGADELLDRLRRACASYLENAGRVPIGDSGRADVENRALQYDGGLLVALLLDIRLREATGGAAGLDDLMRRMYGEFGAGRGTYGLADVSRIASALAGADLSAFFDEHVAGTAALPLARELEKLGLAFRADREREILDRGYAVHEVLRIRSLTQTAEGLVVRRSKDAGFEDGDVLVAIDGRDVRTFADIQERTDLAHPGRAVELTVVRGGERIELVHRTGGGEAPRTRSPARVDVSLMEDRSDEQRALLAAIVRG